VPYYLARVIERPNLKILDVQERFPTLREALLAFEARPDCRVFDGWDEVHVHGPAPTTPPKVESPPAPKKSAGALAAAALKNLRPQ